MARAKNTLVQRIALEGGAEVRNELLAMGEAGGTAFKALQQHVKETERATTGFNGKLLELRGRVENVGTAVSKLGERFRFLNTEAARVAGTIAGAFSVRALVDMTSKWTDLTSRVKLAVDTQDDAVEVMGRLGEMADRTFSSLEQTVTGYTQSARALRELGMDTDTTLDFIESLNNAMVISGARGQQAASVMRALTRAMQEGSLKGENLQVVLEQGGKVVEVLADHLGVGVTKFIEMAKAGEVTSDVIQKAMLGAFQELRSEADGMQATIVDAFQRIQNAMLRWVGTTDEATGVSNRIANALIWVAENFDLVANAALVLVGILTTMKGIGLALELLNIGKALILLLPPLASVGAALLANPMTLWALAIVAAATAVLALTGNLDNFVDAVSAVVTPIFEAMGAMTGFGQESDKALGTTTKKTEDFGMAVTGSADNLVKLTDNTATSTDALGTMGDTGVDAATGVSSAIDGTTSSITTLTSQVAKAISSFRELKQSMADTGTAPSGGDAAPGFSGGGSVRGAGTGTSDSILSRLSNGEFVMRTAAVRKFGVGFMQRLNSLQMPQFNAGGLVSSLTSGMSMSPAIAMATPAGGVGITGRPFNLNIGGESFEGLIAPADVAERLTKYALGRQVRSAGRKPNWYGAK